MFSEEAVTSWVILADGSAPWLGLRIVGASDAEVERGA